jgi:quinol monooxygenase YgiN
MMLALSLSVLVPPTRRSDSLASVGELIEPLRAEPDCIGRWLYSDFRDSSAFTLVEDWASRAQLDRHLTSSAYKTLVAAMELSERPPVVSRYSPSLSHNNPRRIRRIPSPLLPRPRPACLEDADNPCVLDTTTIDPTPVSEPPRI